jgi:hypothetical protein
LDFTLSEKEIGRFLRRLASLRQRFDGRQDGSDTCLIVEMAGADKAVGHLHAGIKRDKVARCNVEAARLLG